jgi:drug/metabolite transporter (DMT)-like permease
VAKSGRFVVGVVYLLAAVAGFSTSDTMARLLATAAVPAFMAVWFRYTFQLFSVMPLLLRQGRKMLYTSRPGWQLLRGLMMYLSALMAFISLEYLPLAEFTSVIMLTPLCLMVLATRMMGERVTRAQRVWLILAFVGAMCVVQPGHLTTSWVLIFPAGCVAASVAYQLLTSRMIRTENPVGMHFYTGLIGTIASTALLPLAWQAPTSLTVWAWLGLFGLVSSLGHFLLIYAYRHASVSSLTPFLYAQIGFASFAGWLVFGYRPNALALSGIVLIAVSGAACTWLMGVRAAAPSRKGVWPDVPETIPHKLS